MTPIVRLGVGDDREALRRAAAAVAAGRLIAFPTDTFYALGADPWNPRAVEALYRLKGRPGDKPLLLLVPDRSWAARLWERPDPRLEALAARLWPGPLTIVAPPGPGAPPLPPGAGLALRLPGNPLAVRLLRAVGRPLTGTSANPSGAPAPRSAREAAASFPCGLALVLDGGTFRGELGSTLVAAGPGGLAVLREGAVSASQVARAAGAGHS